MGPWRSGGQGRELSTRGKGRSQSQDLGHPRAGVSRQEGRRFLVWKERGVRDTGSHEADLHGRFVKLMHLGPSHLELLFEWEDL